MTAKKKKKTNASWLSRSRAARAADHQGGVGLFGKKRVPRVAKTLKAGSLGSAPPPPPKRDDITPGQYMAMIVGTPKPGFIGPSRLNKITVTFQILYEVLSDGSKNHRFAGRQVWQDYVFDQDLSVDRDINATRLYDLKMLLLATETPHDDDGFDPDDIGSVNNLVKIWIKTRESTTIADGVKTTKVYTNLYKIDTGKVIDNSMMVDDTGTTAPNVDELFNRAVAAIRDLVTAATAAGRQKALEDALRKLTEGDS